MITILRYSGHIGVTKVYKKILDSGAFLKMLQEDGLGNYMNKFFKSCMGNYHLDGIKNALLKNYGNLQKIWILFLNYWNGR